MNNNNRFLVAKSRMNQLKFKIAPSIVLNIKLNPVSEKVAFKSCNFNSAGGNEFKKLTIFCMMDIQYLKLKSLVKIK